MRIFPIALIVIGSLGLAKHLGLIPIGMFHLIGPVLLIALGLALLLRRSRSCRGGWRHSQRTGGHDAPTPPSANLG